VFFGKVSLFEDSGLNQREFAKKHGLQTGESAETVRSRLKRLSKPKPKLHGNRLLTFNEELALVGFLRVQAALKTPFSRPEILFLIRRWKNLSADWSGKSFLKKFLARHKSLVRVAIVKDLDVKRVATDGLSKLEIYIKEFEALNAQYAFSSASICNADESPATKLRNHHGTLVVRAEDARPGKMASPKDNLITILPFLCADGHVVAVVHIFKAPTSKNPNAAISLPLPPEEKKTRGSYPIFYAFTDNGFMTKQLWISVITKVAPLFSARLAFKTGLLLLDQLAAHLDVQSIGILHKYNIEVLFFPSHLTHIIQPLDGAVFGHYKYLQHVLSQKLVRKYVQDAEPLISPGEHTVFEASKHSFTPTLIRASFEKAGVWPFDPKKILANGQIALGPQSVLTPLPSSSSLANAAEELVLSYLNIPTPTVQPKRRFSLTKGEAISGMELLKLAAKQDEEREKSEAAAVERKRKREESRELARGAKKRKISAVERKSKPVPSLQCSLCGVARKKRAGEYRCEDCKVFLVCTKCQKDENIIEDHHMVCHPENETVDESGVEFIDGMEYDDENDE
jgi:hypothetical protein